MSEVTKQSATNSYRERGYALLEKLFPPLVLRIFHSKMHQDLNLNGSQAFLSQTPLLKKTSIEVYSRQYPPMATFHWGVTPRVAEGAGCELLPTYAYFRFYQEGDGCLVHSDRDACEHRLSLTLELADNHPWPLCVEGRRLAEREPTTEHFGEHDFTPLSMRAGDAVVYRGVDHRHGRVEPNLNQSAHVFLHWVDANGPYADQAFDRPMLEKFGMNV
jgi:hypothetical protein